MKKFLSMVLALVMTMSLVTISAGAKSFTDDSKITYKEAVDVVSALKIVDGYTDGSFNPQNTLTRGAAAKIICNLILGPTTASALSADAAPFKDVPANHEFAGYIAYCAQQGIINGYADGTFRPAGTLNGYAFMKMLLGALGYDGSIEKYTGANWSVNVAKQALGLGLDKGNEDFVGSEAVNREEACLYAFNTLQATMVEYENTNSIVIGDVTVNTSSKAKEMENSVSGDNTIKKDGKMQFAEKYFDNLKKEASDSDEFNRPATTWKIKSSAIGTYSDTPDVTYTSEVKMGDIYKDLGLSSKLDLADVTYYLDGKDVTDTKVDFANGDDKTFDFGVVKGDSTKIGGNGVITEVFYDDDKDTATITMMTVYLGEVSSTHKASGSRDAYITVETKYDSLGVSGGNYETDESFDEDDLVLFNYTYKDGDKGVQNVRPAGDAITGTLSSFTANKTVNVGGESYKANFANKHEVKGYENAVDNDVTIYTDENGYVVWVDTDATDNNYAVVLAYGTIGTLNDRAKLLFTDGTTSTVDLKSVKGTVNEGDIVSYTKTSGNEYKLTLLADTADATDTGAFALVSKSDTKLQSDSSATALKANVTADSKTVSKANGKTIFLIATLNGNDEAIYNVYEGIANVPTVTVQANKTVPYTAFVKGDASVAKVVYINATGEDAVNIAGRSKDAIFVKGGSGGSSYDSTLGTYWEYDAIINGSFEKIKTDTAVTKKTMFGDGTLINGVYSLSNGVAEGGADVNGTASAGNVGYGVGIEKSGSDVVVIEGDYLVLADNYKVYRVDKDGNIDETAYTSFSKDKNDKVWYKTVDEDVTTLVIFEQEDVDPVDTYSLTAVTNVTFSLDNSTWTANAAEAGETVYVKADTDYVISQGNLALTDVGAGVYSFTMPKRDLVAADILVSANYGIKNVEVKNDTGTLKATWAFDGVTLPTDAEISVAYYVYKDQIFGSLGTVGSIADDATEDTTGVTIPETGNFKAVVTAVAADGTVLATAESGVTYLVK